MKRLLLIGLMFIFFCSFSYGLCIVTLSPDPVAKGSTLTADMVCNSGNEKNQPYTLTWTDQDTNIVQTDIGTTPSVAGIDFFQTYQVPLSSTDTTITATLTGTNLEGSDTASITDAPSNALTINDCRFKPKAFIGADFSVDCEVVNNQSKKIDNAHCFVYSTDENDAPLQLAEMLSESTNGRFVGSGELKPENLKEDTSYLAKIKCHCETGDNKCWDEDGNDIEKHQGSTSIAFLTAKWLDVTTLVNMESYEGRQVATVCANVTNIDGEERVPMEIYYQLRCGEMDDDTDRVVIAANPLEQPDKRGISVNTTQNQCWGLIVPEKRWMQGRNNPCYASTEVWVLNEEDTRIKGYFTTSPEFNITIGDLGVNPDWEVTGTANNILISRVNMSDSKYNDYFGTFIGNIDMRLDLNTPEFTDAYTDSSRDGILIFDQFYNVQDIQSISTKYCNGTDIENALEVTNEGFVEIEVKNVNQSNACIDLEVKIDSIDGGNNMIAIIMSSGILILLMFVAGYISQNKNSQDENIKNEIAGYPLFFYSMGIIQILTMTGIIYGNEAGIDLLGVFRINFYTLFLISFGIALIGGFTWIFNRMNYGRDISVDNKWNNNKFGKK